jgi:glutamate carboxypeptidase
MAVNTVAFNFTQYMKDLEYLVNIDSGSHTVAGTVQMADFFASAFETLGWNVQRLELASDIGPCLEVSNGKGPYDVLICVHMDTVFAEGTVAKRPFTVRDGQAFGPGVVDMKSCCLSVLYGLRAMQEDGSLGGAKVCVAFNSEEEIGSHRARPWLEQLSQQSRHVFVIEGARANGALVNMRKGGGRYSLTFTGLAAHAGVEPEKGINAVNELGYWIVALQQLNNYPAGTSVNVGVVSGGSAANVVPDLAQAEVDFRFTDYAEAKRIRTAIDDLLAHPHTPGIQVHVEGGISRPPMVPTDKTDVLCRAVEQAGRDLGIDVQWAGTGGGSDGNFSAAMGIPTIDGLGPIGGNAHGEREFLNIDSIEPRLNLLCRSILAAARLK